MNCRKCGAEVFYKPTLLSRLIGWGRQICPKCGESLDLDTENRYNGVFTVLIAILAGTVFWAVIGAVIAPYVRANWHNATTGDFDATAARLSGAGWGAFMGALLGLYIGIRKMWNR